MGFERPQRKAQAEGELQKEKEKTGREQLRETYMRFQPTATEGRFNSPPRMMEFPQYSSDAPTSHLGGVSERTAWKGGKASVKASIDQTLMRADRRFCSA